MGLWQAGSAAAASPVVYVSRGKRRRHRHPQPGRPWGARPRSRAARGTGGRLGEGWGMAVRPGKHPRGRAAAQGYFHELPQEIVSSKGGLGVPRGKADSMRRKHPDAGPAGAGIFSKGSCDSHKHLLAHNWLERHDARLWKVKLHPSAPCFRLGTNSSMCSGGLLGSWQVSEVLESEV